ncbi:MAG TPA: hypothetical protein PLZ30_08320, partial [Deltaproteobacteria bacterium]|nr:hypothetical protein [Deltaproteobacteria bacterium]HOS28890.1 hypothetical protein [Deltaproteobacteria bacterium]HRC98152.1 hypothetical protein [Deltaproteobacteria bacterium]
LRIQRSQVRILLGASQPFGLLGLISKQHVAPLGRRQLDLAVVERSVLGIEMVSGYDKKGCVFGRETNQFLLKML